MKDRNEAWSRVEHLAMRHPSYTIVRNQTNALSTRQPGDSIPLDEDGDASELERLTIQDLEAKANEVQLKIFIIYIKIN